MGADVVTQKEAWQVFQKLSRDQRVTFLHEPSGIEDDGGGHAKRFPSTNTWTDAYLAAFA